MLSASWPSPVRLPRPVPPPHVRRRVNAAERRAIRASIVLASPLVAVFFLVDVLLRVSSQSPGALTFAPWELLGGAFALAMAVVAKRSLVRPEAAALAVLVVSVAVALLGIELLPDGRMLSTAQLAILIVGTGLFIPWSHWWHVSAMALSVGMSAAFVVAPWTTGLPPHRGMNLVVAVISAAVISLIGHATWQRRLRALLVQQFALRHLSRYAQRQEAHVTELNRELNLVARRDALTGVGNRLALDEALNRLLARKDRLRPMPFALALFDIDHFKAFNDEHGHLAGDAALERLGAILRRATRSDDLAFRYGGEEFLVLLPDVDLAGAIAVAERIRVAVEEDETRALPPFTISGGVALCDPADGHDAEPLLRRADAALYLAKRAGRNRIATDDLSVAMQRADLASA
jgi:diguanylate cyclase (GGDEF)-like protein